MSIDLTGTKFEKEGYRERTNQHKQNRTLKITKENTTSKLVLKS